MARRIQRQLKQKRRRIGAIGRASSVSSLSGAERHHQHTDTKKETIDVHRRSAFFFVVVVIKTANRGRRFASSTLKSTPSAGLKTNVCFFVGPAPSPFLHKAIKKRFNYSFPFAGPGPPMPNPSAVALMVSKSNPPLEPPEP